MRAPDRRAESPAVFSWRAGRRQPPESSGGRGRRCRVSAEGLAGSMAWRRCCPPGACGASLMPLPTDLLTCTARAVAANLARLLRTGVDDEIIARIWRAYLEAVPDEEQRRQEARALASADPEE